jgi:beta-glucosidase
MGHGLGYSTWSYTDASVSVGGPSPAVSVTVANTGERDSREVVQVYLEPSSSDEPVRLVGWAAVSLAAGESARVRVQTDARLWRAWDTESGGWSRIADGGRLLVARGLGDVRASLPL